MNTTARESCNPWEGTGTLAEVFLCLFDAGKTDWCARNAKYVSHQDELASDIWEYDKRIRESIPRLAIVPF